jgi:hypothetical protein
MAVTNRGRNMNLTDRETEIIKVHIDPPFDVGTDFSADIEVGGSR